MKQIGIAIQNYHDQHKCLPPAVINDQQGIPIHSWRAILLPYYEDEECASQAQHYRLDEPWNGPNNRKLLDKAPKLFRCPSDEDNISETNYIAVTGAETIWRGIQPMMFLEMTDGVSKSIAVVECSDSGINWLEPRDVTFHDATVGINKLTGRPGIRSFHAGGADTLFADGTVHFLSDDIKPETLRALLTPAGGENVQVPW